jgi:hypothetical protein
MVIIIVEVMTLQFHLVVVVEHQDGLLAVNKLVILQIIQSSLAPISTPGMAIVSYTTHALPLNQSHLVHSTERMTHLIV